VMHRHQHAPLPLERLKDVPQPVVILLEKLLEKDPGRRIQNPADLLNAIATIRGAIEARRRILVRAYIAFRLPLRPRELAGHRQDRDRRKFR